MKHSNEALKTMFSLLKTDSFHQNDKHIYHITIINTGVINLKHFHQNTVNICFGFMRPCQPTYSHVQNNLEIAQKQPIGAHWILDKYASYSDTIVSMQYLYDIFTVLYYNMAKVLILYVPPIVFIDCLHTKTKSITQLNC